MSWRPCPRQAHLPDGILPENQDAVALVSEIRDFPTGDPMAWDFYRSVTRDMSEGEKFDLLWRVKKLLAKARRYEAEKAEMERNAIKV